ncbi:MAG: DUF4179 domain-containing protein [Ruminococcaceae bacterium]|nr:DUF4179 domain-containing protein [Oscillospiraceae bacterium]
MNRNTEYTAMLEELNQPASALDFTLDRAYKKKRKRTTKMIARPLTALAACFALFVVLVNFSAPVAYACSQIPVLRELADAVTFSRSLSDAVENQYVQPMELTQTENDITARVEYLIVDQKQVNIFFRLDSDVYTQLLADPDVNKNNENIGFCIINNDFHAENGKLRSISVDFTEGNVPDTLQFILHVYSDNTDYSQAPSDQLSADYEADFSSDRPNYLANFEFTLEFDPAFTATGKVFPVNETVILDGQAITITNVEVYPTHMRVEVGESPDNTAWLKGLAFYIETDLGMKFEPVSNGIVSTGTADSPSMVSYRADSTYFYEAKHLKLVITGAQWLRKDMEKTYLNLLTGEHGELPEGAAFDSAERQGSGWVVTFRAALQEDGPMYQLFRQTFYDADGNEYEINQWSHTYGDADENGNNTYFYDEFPLRNYPYDEVWLSPQFSHNWVAENQIILTIQ